MKIKIKREKKDITIISLIIQVLKKGKEESVNKILLRTLKENWLKIKDPMFFYPMVI